MKHQKETFSTWKLSIVSIFITVQTVAMRFFFVLWKGVLYHCMAVETALLFKHLAVIFCSARVMAVCMVILLKLSF